MKQFHSRWEALQGLRLRNLGHIPFVDRAGADRSIEGSPSSKPGQALKKS